MILQALKEYYDRKPIEGSIAKDGWISRSIDFLIDLDIDGNIKNVIDTKESKGNKKTTCLMDVPNIGKQALKHANNGKDANLLWDNASFVFGLGDKGDLRLQGMIKAINQWIGETDDPGIIAVKSFLEKGQKNRSHFDYALLHPKYGELIKEGNVRISFSLSALDCEFVFNSPIVAEALKKMTGQNISSATHSTKGVCLLTGDENALIELTHPVAKGVWGSQTSGACIVSFNKDAFNSYSKKQGLNAPVSKVATSQYNKALNALLASKTQCIHIGDTSIVFWSEKKSSFESIFSELFSEFKKGDPNKEMQKVKTLFESINSKEYIENSDDTKFYILGLAPNTARISVRFWQTGTIFEFASYIKQYFEDFAIVKPPKEPEFYSLWHILVNISTQDKSENIPPNLLDEVMRSILNKIPYPATLLQATLRRIRSDTENRVKPIRAALIKAYLNRYYKYNPNKAQKEITMELDISQPSTGYQLGRLFATLEKIQEEANPKINATIRKRFYEAACTTPIVAFTSLLCLKNHHLAKIENKGRVVNFERLLGEIVGNFKEFPAYLSLHEQGMFAVGYYHQRQKFFSKKENTNNYETRGIKQ